MAITVTTNNVPRPTIDSWDLTPEERADFDYLDWAGIEAGEDSATFFRYRGTLYDLGDFPRVTPQDHANALSAWDGLITDSFFSGVVVRYVHGDPWIYPDYEYVVVGSVYAD